MPLPRRYAFAMLDADMDGLVAAETIDMYDMFGPYSPAVLAWALRHWRFESGMPLIFTAEDFVRFVEYADDRSSPEAIKFWFGCLDYDGDGCGDALVWCAWFALLALIDE